MPIIIQIDYYLFEMKVCEASLEKKSTFKDVKQILCQRQIPFSKTTTLQNKITQVHNGKDDFNNVFSPKLLHINKSTYNESPHSPSSNINS